VGGAGHLGRHSTLGLLRFVSCVRVSICSVGDFGGVGGAAGGAAAAARRADWNTLDMLQKVQRKVRFVNFAATVVERPRSPGRVAGGREAGK
jgi:hypothetical protein